MLLTFEDMSTRLLSPRLWGKLAPPTGGGMQAFSTASGNPAIGMFDDFFEFSETKGTGGYLHVETSSGTVTQIASDGTTASTGMGICQLLTTAGDNSEAMLVYGNALDAPFKLTGNTLCFEARVKLTDITTASHGFFLGLSSTLGAVTVKTITATDAIFATADFIGFQQLKAETTAVDGMYQVSGDTKVDGAVNTGLDSIATIGVTNFIKLGFRFNPQNGGSVQWFIDGVEDLGARLRVPTIETDNANSFPDGAFMTPNATVMNDGTTAVNLEIDWWACAQYE